MTRIKPFEHPSFGQIRTITAENGEPLFCGRDVAQALGYANSRKALNDHCRSKGVTNHYPLETAGGIQQARFITEGDVYRLIFNSKLPAAQAFETWVFDEVLPSIRKHGAYAIDEVLDNDELLEQVIVRLRQERTKRLIAQQQLLEASPIEQMTFIYLPENMDLATLREFPKLKKLRFDSRFPADQLDVSPLKVLPQVKTLEISRAMAERIIAAEAFAPNLAKVVICDFGNSCDLAHIETVNHMREAMGLKPYEIHSWKEMTSE